MKFRLAPLPPGVLGEIPASPPGGWVKFSLASLPKVVSIWEGLEVREQKQGKETRKWRGVVDESRSGGSLESR